MSTILQSVCRVSYRPVGGGPSLERSSHVEVLAASGCTIQSHQPPASNALELQLELPDGERPMQIQRAHVLWGDWKTFTVEFRDLPAADQRRLRECLWTMSLLQEH